MTKFLIMLLALAMVVAPFAHAEGESADMEQTDKLLQMLPVLDSVMRTVQEDASSYDPGNAEFVWGVLYRLGVNYGLDYPDTSIDDETYDMLIPGALVRSFAAAAFPTLTAVPEPGNGSSYDAAADLYRMPGSDMGETSVRMDGYVEKDGALVVTVTMVDYDGSKLDEMAFRVTEATEDALFPYVVMGVE